MDKIDHVDIATLANVTQAVAVVVGVIFGIVQLRQLTAQRRRESAFALMQSSQSPQVLRAVLIIEHLPDTAGKAEIDALPKSDQADVIALLSTWEGLGILVFNHEIPLQMVDDFYSGTVAQSWRKLQRYIEELRKVSSRPTDWEWFQWLAERMQEEELASPPVPAHVQHRNWKRAS
jgi:hypothetical protein